MALGDIGDELSGLARRMEDSSFFDDIVDSVRELNRHAMDVNERIGRDLVNSVRGVSRGFGDVATQVEKIKLGVASTNSLQSKAAQALSKQNQLMNEANRLRAVGTTRANDQADNMELAAEQAQILNERYQRLADINDQLNRNTQFFKGMEKLTKKIPGLEGVSQDFRDAAQSVRESLIEGNTPVRAITAGINVLAKAVGVVFLAQLIKVDQQVTDMTKNLNLSREEAIGLKQTFAVMAFDSEDIAINSERLAKANTELNTQLGTAAIFSKDILGTYSKLVEVAGLTTESASSLAFQALRSGETLREVEENALAASFAMQRSTGIAFNNREILEETGKITGQVRANLHANPELLARAVTQARLFGAEIDDIVTSQNSLLDFETSIGNELSAELLTGKQLNLERARALALAGNQEGLARELANQAGSFTEFTKLNVIQQQELAGAFGLSADRLSDILFKQEVQGKTARELRAIGKGELADRLEQLSAQQKLALSLEKFRTIMGDIATILLPIVEVFGNIVQYISESKVLASALVGVLGALAIKSVVNAVASIFAGSSMMGPLGLGIAAAGVGVMYGMLSQAKAQTVQDGIAQGNGPFTVTDKFGRMAVTHKDDGLVVSPNINKQAQPVTEQFQQLKGYLKDIHSNSLNTQNLEISPKINVQAQPISVDRDSFKIKGVNEGVKESTKTEKPPPQKKTETKVQPIIIKNTFSNFKSSGPYALASTQRRQATPTFA